MDRMDKVGGDGLPLAQSSRFQKGLRQTFAACHDPLPVEMEELLQRLRDDEFAVVDHRPA